MPLLFFYFTIQFLKVIISYALCPCYMDDAMFQHLIDMQVAILDGITMGGGAGVSIPGMFRVATDRTVCNSDNVMDIPF
ncbi:hypothetical protein CK203_030052 [Vitis vinifera]|uniref:3-hydroxyisobutyryl-CoA hydrolase n=1 Tax=Vitis vinifera TaxID=29760 RepID=A0A438IK53_VITVI|nr:hypothetical protein CK203_030052 [Vitis vinifera]